MPDRPSSVFSPTHTQCSLLLIQHIPFPQTWFEQPSNLVKNSEHRLENIVRTPQSCMCLGQAESSTQAADVPKVGWASSRRYHECGIIRAKLRKVSNFIYLLGSYMRERERTPAPAYWIFRGGGCPLQKRWFARRIGSPWEAWSIPERMSNRFLAKQFNRVGSFRWAWLYCLVLVGYREKPLGEGVWNWRDVGKWWFWMS
jgi:hypothetical protein